MKKILKDNIFYILFFIGYFAFTLLFPYTGDDWYWGSLKLDFNIFQIFHDDIELNGRYLGNLLAIILSKNIYIRGFIMSFIITCILKLLHSFIKVPKYLLIFFIFFLSSNIFRQVIPWSAGFANYTISLFFLLLIGYILLNKEGLKYDILIFILTLAGSLFMENHTIFLLGLTIYLNIRYYLKNKKINYLYLFALIGSLDRFIIMFSHPTYPLAFSGESEVREVGGEVGIITIAIHNLFHSFCYHGISTNYVLFGVLLYILLYYSYKNNKLNGKILILFFISYLLFLYNILGLSLPFLQERLTLNGIIAIIYLLIIFSLLFILFRKDKSKKYIWYILIICIVINAPIIIAFPIGARNFLSISVLLFILTIKLANDLFDLNNRWFLLVSKIFLLGFIIIYTVLFVNIHKVYQEREDYIIKNQCNTVIFVPKVPDKFVWWPDLNSEKSPYYTKYYKKFRNLPENMYFALTEYDDWKENYSFSTCS